MALLVAFLALVLAACAGPGNVRHDVARYRHPRIVAAPGGTPPGDQLPMESPIRLAAFRYHPMTRFVNLVQRYQGHAIVALLRR
jgi:hypothetical protein